MEIIESMQQLEINLKHYIKDLFDKLTSRLDIQ